MRKFVRFMMSGIIVVSFLSASHAQSAKRPSNQNNMTAMGPAPQMQMRKITNAQRKAAAAKAAQRRAKERRSGTVPVRPKAQLGVKTNLMGAGVSAPVGPALTLDQLYFGTYPNFANSPLPQTDVNGNVIGGGIRKFVDTLPGLNTPNNLGQQIPVAVPDTATFPGSDYYEIAVEQYQEQMHSDLTPTMLRGYVQLNAPTTMVPHYLGPLIIAQKDVPVRIKFVNLLPTGTGGDLFIPVDKTVMGAGMGPDGMSSYLENRATLHLHGGNTPWISDGTPHQWTVPSGDSATTYPKGVSTAYVPDMFFDSTGNVVRVPKCDATVKTNCWPSAVPAGLSNDPGPGAMTFYYTNQQSARLMFYHDHAYGITRLNVYAGEAAGYLLQDPTEAAMVNAGAIPTLQIPLVIQDKTFVPPNPASTPLYSIGMLSGGQDYNPATTTVTIDSTGTACTVQPTGTPVIGDTLGDFGSVIPNAVLSVTITNKGMCSSAPDVIFADSSVPAGTGAAAFGSLATLAQQDPMWDPSLWGGEGNFWFPHVYMPNQYPDNPDGSNMNPMGRLDYGMWFWPPMVVGPPGSGQLIHGDIPCPTAALPNQRCPGFPAPGNPDPVTGTTVSLLPEAFMDTPVVNGTAYPTVTVPAGAVRFRILNAANDRTLNLSLFVADTTVPCANGVPNPGCEVKMVPSAPTTGWPVYWPTDGREGGVPDPATAGPAWIQIGNEAGFIPKPVVIPPTPIGYEYNRRSVTVLNVATKSLMMGPAERADVIVDFSPFAGQTLILYNDAPAPVPAFDTRYDYYTGDPDQTGIGGAPSTIAGYGPNTRTIMQIVVSGTGTPANLAALNAQLPAAFAASQPAPIVPQAAYSAAYGQTFPDVFARLQNHSLTFTPVGGTGPVTLPMQDKTIQELFELDYGRMNATLGTELPFTNFLTQTTIPLGYIDPPSEIIQDSAPVGMKPVGVLGDGTQLWQITHNGVDTHTIHFHLFNVQLINRFGWDGTTRPPDPNEIGWKEAVRMNPLEIDYVALRAMSQNLPWPIPDSTRPLDITMPADVTDLMMSLQNATGGAADMINHTTNFGWEYVWHCHLLGHEENDMMRAIVFQVAPPTPSNLTAVSTNGVVTVSFTDNAASETGFYLQRAGNPDFLNPTALGTLAASNYPPFGGTVTFKDTPGAATAYWYRVQAFSPNGVSAWVSTQMTTASPLAITADNQTMVYGTGLPAFTVTPTGLIGSDTLPSLGFVQICTTTATASSPVGSYPIDCSASTLNAPNYIVTYVAGTLQITPATASVTPNAASKTYGQVDPVLTGTLNGFLLTDGVTATYTRTAGEAVGSYTITATVAPASALGNYTITYNTGIFTITPAAASVTPNPATKIVGSPDPVLTGTLTGFLPTDGVTASYTRTAGETVGTYTISATLAPTAVLSNYAITSNTATFTITPSGPVLGLSPTSLTFSSPVNVVSASQPVVITNLGTGALIINSISFTGANPGRFGQTSNCPIRGAGLAAGANCTVNVVFTPNSTTTRTASLTVRLAAPAVSGSVALTGTTVVPTVNVSPATIPFGAQPINTTSAAQVVTVTNTGAAPLVITRISLGGTNPGRFAQTNNCPIGGTGLAVGGSCTVNVTFTPTRRVAYSATVTVRDNAGTGSQVVTLSGNGQ